MFSYSDAYQDVFTLKLFNNQPGYYLDIGCSDGISKNNTYLLEKNGWTGLLFDISVEHIKNASNNRNSKAIQKDISQPDTMLDILNQENCPRTIEYISLDIDEASLECLNNFPLDKYRFKFLTFEHDIYAGRPDCIDRKNITPIILEKFGYIKIADNVSLNGLHYEDWYADPEYFDLNRFSGFINSSGLSYQEIYKLLN